MAGSAAPVTTWKPDQKIPWSVRKASSAAVQTLRGVMKDPAARPSARVTAARAVLEMAQKGIELKEVIDRVAALERAFEEKGRKQ